MSQKKYVVDAARLKMRRNECDLSQGELINQVKYFDRTHPGIKEFSKSYLKMLEREDRPVSQPILNALTMVLQCDAGDIIATTLADQHEIPRMRSAKLEDELQDAVVRDIRGDSREAATICERILSKIDLNVDVDDYVATLVRLMTFLDHAGDRKRGTDHKRAIDLAEEFLVWHQSQHKQQTPGVLWVSYQLGVCLRQFSFSRSKLAERRNELHRAKDIFEQLLVSTEHQIAARHQLGVACLELFRLERRKRAFLHAAESHFRDSREQWSKNDDHRAGYSARRLGQICSERGDVEHALELYHGALVTLAWHHCKRDVDATLAEISELLAKRRPTRKK